MEEFDLQFRVPDVVPDKLARATFFWPTSGPSSFRTSLGPRLGELGPVPPKNVDLVRLAAMVYAADRSVSRRVGKVNWVRRQIALTVPVSDPAAWDGAKAELEGMLDFLSGDDWVLKFRSARPPNEATAANPYPDAKRVVLMSGGADSAVGAFLARSQPEEHVLVSHIGATTISPIQKGVASQIEQLLPGGSKQHHRQITFTRTLRQPGGVKLRNDFTTRARSLLFLALGLAVASINRVPLWIAENGFASLNPPLGADQLGSLSTRTTHPWFLAQLSAIARSVGAAGDIENPFATQTKGEMFRWLADHLSDDEAASEFLSSTNSCANTNRRFAGATAKTHCGVCFGCLMRKASFMAAGLKDQSTYVADAPPTPEIAAALKKLSIRPSIEAFVTRGIGVGDVAAMRLPAGYRASAAKALCDRGAAELELLI